MSCVLFYIPYDKNNHTKWNGQSIRNGGIGVSGTHQSYIIAAEQLLQNSSIKKAYMFNHCDTSIVKQVEYIDDLKTAKDADTIIVPTWVHSFDFIKEHLPNIKHIVVWFHWHFLFGTLAKAIMEYCNSYKNISVSFVHICKWSTIRVQQMTPPELTSLIKHNIVIPNALMSDMLPNVMQCNTNKNHDIVFLAGFDRGGLMAKRVYQNLKKNNVKWGEFHSREYYKKGYDCDKKSVFDLLLKCRYFIYPLVLPPDEYPFKIHRDTFACCVAEAIACGVEVLTYPVAALSEYYDGLVHWIPFPSDVTTAKVNDPLPDPYFPSMFSEDQVDVITRIVEELDNTYEQRAQQRQMRAERVRDLYSATRIGEKWSELFKEINIKKQPTTYVKNKHSKAIL